MAQAADIGSKRLISLAPDLWVQWVTQIPNVEAREIVTSEFQWVIPIGFNNGTIDKSSLLSWYQGCQDGQSCQN
jgi:hypothetical protein